MKRKLLRASIVALILLLVLAIPVLASYSATITVTESSGNSYTMLPIIDTMGISSMITSGFISSTGLDTRVKYGNTELPHMLADDKLLFVSDITANTSKQFTFSTDNTALADFPIIVGVGGYVTTPDNADLEPGDNFELEISLNIADTSYTVFNKLNALRLDYNATTDVLTLTVGTYASPDYTLTATGVEPGEHTITLLTGYEDSSETVGTILRPTSDGSTNGIYVYYPGQTEWWDNANEFSYVDEVVIDDTDGVRGQTNTNMTPLFNISPGTYASISSVKVVIRAKKTSTSIGHCVPKIKLNGTSYDTDIFSDNLKLDQSELNNDYCTYQSSWFVNPDTGTTWSSGDLTGLQFGAYFPGMSLGWAMMSQAYLVVSSGDFNPTLNLYVDGILVDDDSLGNAIPDNSNPWLWYPNPCIEYIKLETAN